VFVRLGVRGNFSRVEISGPSGEVWHYTGKPWTDDDIPPQVRAAAELVWAENANPFVEVPGFRAPLF
jgi:hypothetical protein